MTSHVAPSEIASVAMRPIGVVRSPFHERADAPRQPPLAREVRGEVQLFPGRGFEDALSDLTQWDHIWLVVWFHLNAGYRPKVQPPRSAHRRGVFATRAPYRPNPIGLSAVRLLKVEGLTLSIQGLDLLDETPVLDIKPYVPYSDCIADAGHGWLAHSAGAAAPDPMPSFEVRYAPLAQEQLGFLQAQGVALKARVDAALALGPTPHAYRRIRRDQEGYRLAIKDWRVRFGVVSHCITVQAVRSGYRPRELFDPSGQAPPVHRAFVDRFPGQIEP